MSAPTPFLFGAAGVLLAVGEAVDVQSVGTTARAQVQHYLAAPGLLDVAAACFFVGAIVLVLAVASASADVVGRGGTASRIGLGMIGAGAVWYAASRGASDVEDAQLRHLPTATQIAALSTDPGWVSNLDLPVMLAWLLGPVVLWIGLRRARRASWVLLAVYVVAVAVEFAFAFVSLPIEGITTLVAVGTIAAMIRTSQRSSVRAAEPAAVAV